MPLTLAQLIVIDFDKKIRHLFKGDNLRTEIKYKKSGRDYLFTGFSNVMDPDEIEKFVGKEGYDDYFNNGEAYYVLFNNPKTKIRIFDKRINLGGYNSHYIDYNVGEVYSKNEWEYFIDFLKKAGKRLSDIKRNHYVKEETIYI